LIASELLPYLRDDYPNDRAAGAGGDDDNRRQNQQEK
jgi:hypothetical protein